MEDKCKVLISYFRKLYVYWNVKVWKANLYGHCGKNFCNQCTYATLNLSWHWYGHMVCYQLIGVMKAMDFNVVIQLFKLIVTRKLNLLFVTSWGSLIWDSIWTNEIIWYNLIALNPTTTSCLRKTRKSSGVVKVQICFLGGL